MKRTVAQSMFQLAKALLCSLSCIILLMPQGWCCWLVSLNCCSQTATSSCCVPVEKADCCCCHPSSEDLPCKDTDTSIPLKCYKCIHEVIRPALEKSFDLIEIPVTILPFNWQCSSHEIHLESHAKLLGFHPPLHVQLCVWRC